MTAPAYLDTHPPASPQFRDPRRDDPSGVVVVHTAENVPDFVAFDGGAEAVAQFITARGDPGSYHELGDSDSCIRMVREECEAFHDATGSNRHSFGVSIATRADVWPLAPSVWRDGAIRQIAGASSRYARWLYGERHILIPARRITRAESEARVAGFISHAERDPARRTDPGAGFPWNQFLATYARLVAVWHPTHPPTPPPIVTEEDMRIMDCKGKPAVIVFADRTYNTLNDAQRDAWRDLDVPPATVTPEHRATVLSFLTRNPDPT